MLIGGGWKGDGMTPLSFDYPISVAILYLSGNDGDLAETLEAVKNIGKALEAQGHTVRVKEVNQKNWREAVRTPGEVVFNLVEDHGFVLYMKVARAIEELGRAQVGLDMGCFKYVVSKSKMKRRMLVNGVSTPDFKIFNRRSKFSNVRRLEYPLIVKPSGEHAGIGISQDSVVIDGDELKDRVKYLFGHFPGEVVAEEYIEGREIHVTVMGNGRHVFALSPAEIEFGGEFGDNWSVYTYEAKWEKRSWEYWSARVESPAMLGRKTDKRIEALAVKAYKVFGCRDIARLDIRVDDKGRGYVVDVNMCPSLNSGDDQDATLASVKALGWSYEQFLETLVAITYKRVYGRLPDRMRERRWLLAAPAKPA